MGSSLDLRRVIGLSSVRFYEPALGVDSASRARREHPYLNADAEQLVRLVTFKSSAFTTQRGSGSTGGRPLRPTSTSSSQGNGGGDDRARIVVRPRRLDRLSGEGHACRSDIDLREAMLPIARVMTREGDQEELERQYQVVAGRMNELPLADGLLAHIALKRPNGVEVINVWESLEQSQAAFERPEFQEALREAGMSPDDMQPEDVEVLNVRTR